MRWVCDEIIIPNWNDNDDKSNVTVDCTSKGGFGTFEVLKLNLKRLSATSVYVINDWVLVDFGTCKKLL